MNRCSCGVYLKQGQRRCRDCSVAYLRSLETDSIKPVVYVEEEQAKLDVEKIMTKRLDDPNVGGVRLPWKRTWWQEYSGVIVGTIIVLILSAVVVLAVWCSR